MKIWSNKSFLLFSGSILPTNRLEQKDSKQLGQKLKMEKANNVQQIRLNVNTRNFVFQNSYNAMVCIIVAEMSMEISTNQMSSLVSLIRIRHNLLSTTKLRCTLLTFEPFFFLLWTGVKESEMNEYVVIGLGLGVISIVMIAVFLLCHRKRKRRRLEHPSKNNVSNIWF